MPTTLHFKASVAYQLVSVPPWFSSLLIDPFFN